MREREHERERLEGKDGAAGAGSLVDALWQAARLSERRADAQLARLDRLAGPGAGGEGGGAGGRGTGDYWVTAEALRQRWQRERRLLVAAAALAAELWQWAGGPPDGAAGAPSGGTAGREWGRTDVALEYWMRRGGWRGAGTDETAAALAAAGGGGWCVHCGHPVHELRLFVRAAREGGAGREEREVAGGGPGAAVCEALAGYGVPPGAAGCGRYRAFSRCNACGLVVELRQGTALAAVEAALGVAVACPAPS